jgi:hypothetical protein
MKRLFGLTIAATTLLSGVAMAATPVRVRGTVTAVTADSVTVHTADKDTTVALTPDTHYLKVVKSSLDNVDKDSFIGTATKQVGQKMIALEVVIFPPAMKGTGEGHYAWDRIHDTTLSGGSSETSSSMTNGTVAAVQSNGATANSSMTNGTVASTDAKGGAKEITVDYKGGTQKILVPPTAPIVGFEPNTLSDVTTGKTVFIVAGNGGGTLTANIVAVGTEGAPPPM